MKAHWKDPDAGDECGQEERRAAEAETETPMLGKSAGRRRGG